MLKDKSIAVVIPAYNEEKNIAQVIKTIPSFIDKIVVVDDKSQDKTAEVVEMLVAKMGERLVLIKNNSNQGCGGALAKGYIWARDNDIDVAVRMDGDGQMEPSELSALLEPVISDEADYTKGNRLFTGQAFQKIPKIRYFGNALLSLLTKIASGYWQIADSQSGYTAISKEALHSIDWDKMYKRYGQPNDLLVLLNVYNFRVKDVPVTPIYNIGERSGINIFKVIFTISWLLTKRFLWRLKEKYIIRDFHPLIFFYLLGFMLLAVSVFLFFKIVFFRIANPYFPPITTLSWMFCISIGFQSLFFAMWFDMDYHRRSK